MPWRLILFAVFLVLLVAFVGVNLDNRCAVSLIFVTYPDVPVYISILISFALGMIIMLPFTFGKKSSKSVSEKPGKSKSAPVKKAPVSKPVSTDTADVPESAVRPVNDD